MIEIDRHPAAAKLRWFAVLQALFFAAMAWQWYRRTGWAAPAVVAAGAALLVGALGLVWPAWVRRYYVGWMVAVFPVGWVVSHAVLAAAYYLVLTPLGLARRLWRGDPLRLRFEREAASYWVTRPPQRPVEDYFRQF